MLTHVPHSPKCSKPEIIWSIVTIVASAITAEFVWLLHQVGMKETNHTRLATNDNSPRKRPQNVEDLLKETSTK